jgi:hypothetical protein
MWTTSLRPISGSGILIDDPARTNLHHEARYGAPADFGAAPAVVWFHSTIDGDSRLQRLRRGICRLLTIGWVCLRWIVAA